MDLRDKYYIYIGIDYTELKNQSLRICFSNDAEEISQILNLPNTNCDLRTSLINKETLEEILVELDSEKYSGYDILIYIAGHGDINRLNKPCLLTSNSEMFQFHDIFDSISNNMYPDNIAVILDCCHSGIQASSKRNLYWIAATSDKTSTNNQFHENLVDYLSNNSNLTIYGLINYLHLHGQIEQPSANIQSNKNFHIYKQKDIVATNLNDYLLRRRARLRTAYPINTSFGQIFESGLYISPTIFDGEKHITLDTCINSKPTIYSQLILGNPGGGKSFLSFLLQKKLANLNYTVVALSFQEVNDLLSTDNKSLEKENIQIKKIIEDAIEYQTKNIFFLIDGLDEFNDWDKYCGFFEKLADKSKIIAFSRDIEYYNYVSKYLPQIYFDEILKVEKWQYENEFIEFLKLLFDKQYINQNRYNEILINAKEFKDYLTTPLLSRMYIYVYETNYQEGVSITTKAELYSSYVSKLSNDKQRVTDFWKEIALDAFIKQRTNNFIISESMYSDKVSEFATDERRIVSYMLQMKKEIYGNIYNFIHYSFYEFFVALSLFSKIQYYSQYEKTNLSLLNLFQFDLNLQIRHYLVDLLHTNSIMQKEEFTSFLYSLYESIEENQNKDLVNKNLIIYLISKQERETSLSFLKNILSQEKDIFIKNSLYWAFIRKEDKQMFELYISLLNKNQEYSSYNRGYHLYYYGDIVSNEFPFIDNRKETNWDKTRKYIMDHRINNSKESSIYIRLLDIWTYLDLAIFHETVLEENELCLFEDSYKKLNAHLGEVTKRSFENLFKNIKNK